MSIVRARAHLAAKAPGMDYLIRPLREDEVPLLEDFLYEAIFVPEGFQGQVPRSIIGDGADDTEWLMVRNLQ